MGTIRVTSAVRNFAELMRQLKRTPRLMRQVARFAELSLQLHGDQYSGPVTLNYRNGFVEWDERPERGKWQ